MPLPPIDVSANLSPTLFEGTAKDVVAVPDIYNLQSTSVINVVQGNANPVDTSIFGQLKTAVKGPLGFLSSVQKEVSSGMQSISTLRQSLLSPVTNVLNSLNGVSSTVRSPMSTIMSTVQTVTGGIQSNVSAVVGTINQVEQLPNRFQTQIVQPITSFPSGIQNNISSAFTSISNQVGSVVSVKVGNTTQTLSNLSSASSIQAAVALTGQLAQNASYAGASDSTVKAATLAAAIIQFLNSGAFDSIPAALAAVTADIQALALGEVATAAVQYSDIDLLTTIVTTNGAAAFTAKVANPISAILRQYNLPKSTVVTDYPGIAAKMVALFSQLQPGWDTYQRGSEALISLTYFARMTDDAKTVLATIPTYAVACAIGSAFRAKPVVQALQSQYPYMLVVPVPSTAPTTTIAS